VSGFGGVCLVVFGGLGGACWGFGVCGGGGGGLGVVVWVVGLVGCGGEGFFWGVCCVWECGVRGLDSLVGSK